MTALSCKTKTKKKKTKRKTNEEAAVDAVRAYRRSLIASLKERRSGIRRGVLNPVDQNGTKIMQSNYSPPECNMAGTVPDTVSILATRASNGELTRLINNLEGEGTQTS